MHHPESRPTASERRGASVPGSSRREVLAQGFAVAAGGLVVGLPLGRHRRPAARARSVIQVFLQGGLSHLDTFDPKPEAPVDVRGSFGVMDTAVDGLRFTRLVPRLARVADRLAVIRSLTHTEAAHERGQHNMLTGYQPSPAIVYPSFGAIVSHELGGRNDLPPYVCIPRAVSPELGTGYLSSAYGPFSVGGEPAARNFEVRDLAPPDGVDAERQDRRRRLVAELDAGFDGAADGIAATAAFEEQAWRLIESADARAAFRIDQEDGAMRKRYGRHAMGQRLLLARRLVEAGVRNVTVVDTGWDHHDQVDRNLRRRMPRVDEAVAALLVDLDERGLLDDTLVLLTTEFGRTPRINRDAGRDHWPRAFTVLAAGGGMRRGVVHGATDDTGGEPVDAAVGPADLAATLFHLLGIDHEKRLMSPGDRPIDIVRNGRVIRELLA